MKPGKLNVHVVSPEGMIFNGDVDMWVLQGAEGELGIAPGHLQLLTNVKPGALRLMNDDQDDEILFVSGGVLEVQPHQATVLADVAERPQDVNESAAIEAAENAKKLMAGQEVGAQDYEAARTDLLEAMARLKVIEMMRGRQKRGR